MIAIKFNNLYKDIKKIQLHYRDGFLCYSLTFTSAFKRVIKTDAIDA